MKNLPDTKRTMTMHLLNGKMCIFAQDRPYYDTDQLIELVMKYGMDKDITSLKTNLALIKVKAYITHEHSDGVLLCCGNIVKEFIYLNSYSENKFSVNGKTNLKEAIHTSLLKYLKRIGIINANREVQDNSGEKIILPERSGLQG